MKKYLLAACVAVTGCQGSAAMAQEVTCAPSEGVRRNLSNMGSVRTFVGIKDNGNQVVEIWAHPNGQWISIVSNPAGVSCILMDGQGFEFPTLKPNA